MKNLKQVIILIIIMENKMKKKIIKIIIMKNKMKIIKILQVFFFNFWFINYLD